MTELVNAMEFLDKARRRMRFGIFSRVPLKLLRVEWKEDQVECDWIMRPADPWDKFLPPALVEEHQTLQALRDALNLRDVVFKAFPSVTRADLCMFRVDVDLRHELMMAGTVTRSNEVLQRVSSIAMRAKLCGFRFSLAQGVLESMHQVTIGCI
jgi:hypothetical protein